jgi:hypothetical protein
MDVWMYVWVDVGESGLTYGWMAASDKTAPFTLGSDGKAKERRNRYKR